MAQLRAFPEAEGYGQFATGGRGGNVYHVTSLGDDANTVGTLRHGIEKVSRNEPLTIVFDVSGYINLNSKLGVTRDNLTIAGQTAPGGGVGIRGDQFSVGADDVIIRHVRFRPGKSAGRVDSLSISSGHDVIFDHVSAAFSYDENVSANAISRGGVSNLTVQHSAVAYGLEDHSAGSLIQNVENLSYHHNLYAHNHTRNPKARVEGKGIDWVGNVVYDYNNGFIAGDSNTTDFFWKANLVGNTYITGPGDTGRPMVKDGQVQNYGLYFGTNAYDNDGDTTHDPVDYTGNGVDATGLGGVVSGGYTWAGTPYGDTPVWLEDSTQKTYEYVLENFGATPWNRDEVDTLVRNNVVNRTGTLIDREGDVDTSPDSGEFTGDDVVSNGGFGTLAPGVAPTDTDRDGLPDAWESANGLLPSRAGDQNVIAPTGYTMLEVYLNELGSDHGRTAITADGGTWTSGSATMRNIVGIGGAVAGGGRVELNGAAPPARAFRIAIGDVDAGDETLLVAAGGRLEVMDVLTIGDAGDAAMQIDTGGQVAAEAVLIGNGAGGFAAIGGGAAGTGSLILDGGTLTTTRIVALDGPGGAAFRWAQGGTVRALRNLTILADAELGASGGQVDMNGFVGTIHGQLSGDGGLTKVGTGTLTLFGSNTYAGGTTVNAGTVVVASDGALGQGDVTVAIGATLDLSDSRVGDALHDAASLYLSTHSRGAARRLRRSRLHGGRRWFDH